MQNGLLAAIVPFDGYPSPIRLNDGTTVGLIVSPANAVANLKESGLVTGHLGAPFQRIWPSISAGVSATSGRKDQNFAVAVRRTLR